MKHPSHFAKVAPDKVAYRMARSGETMTYAELDRTSNRYSHLFRSLGVGQGGNVALIFENRLDLMALAWAGQRGGIFYTAISTHLTVPEVAYIVNDCNATVTVLSDKFAHLVPELRENCPGSRFFVLGEVGDNFGAGMSGGIAYLAPVGDLDRRINPGLVDVEKLDGNDVAFLEEIIDRHRRLTGSTTPWQALDLVKVMPRDYKRVLIHTKEVAHHG